MLSEMTKGRLLMEIEQYRATATNQNIIGMGISTKNGQPAILICLEKEDLSLPSKLGEFPVVKRIFSQKSNDDLDSSEKLMNFAEATGVASAILAGQEVTTIKALSAGIMLSLKSLADKNYLTKNQLEAILSVLKPPQNPSSVSSP